MNWPVRIRLYPERASSALYITVRVWPNLKAMRRDAVALGASDSAGLRSAYGLCHLFTREKFDARGRCRTRPQFGNIFLSATDLSYETIAHEVAHATHGWADRRGIRPTGDRWVSIDDEERRC